MANTRQLEYIRHQEESVWGGAVTGSTTGLPFESYDCAQSNVVVAREKFTGFIDDVNVDVAGQDLAGSAQIEIHPDNATLLLKTIPGIPRVTFNGNPNDFPSFRIEFYDASRNKYFRHDGLKCGSITISCAGPDGELMARYDLQGKSETEISTFAQPTMPDQASFQMKDAWASGASLIKVATIAEPNVENLEITVPNNIRPSERRDNNGQRVWIDPGHRGEIQVNMGIRTSTDWAIDYDGQIRGMNTGTRIEYTFNYPGTGSPIDQVQIILPAVVLSSPARQGNPKSVQTRRITGTAKRTAGTEAISITNT